MHACSNPTSWLLMRDGEFEGRLGYIARCCLKKASLTTGSRTRATELLVSSQSSSSTPETGKPPGPVWGKSVSHIAQELTAPALFLSVCFASRPAEFYSLQLTKRKQFVFPNHAAKEPTSLAPPASRGFSPQTPSALWRHDRAVLDTEL